VVVTVEQFNRPANTATVFAPITVELAIGDKTVTVETAE
jgi:hypothetical protein